VLITLYFTKTVRQALTFQLLETDIGAEQQSEILENSLPFRFKAGGDGQRRANMAATATQHHHRSTTKTVNKSFKTRHASKSALKNQAKGKVEAFEGGSRKTPHQQVMSKFDRKNKAKQRRINHHARKEEEGSLFAGRDGAPRIIAIIPLCDDVKQDEIARTLNSSVDVEDTRDSASGPWRVEIPRFKQRVQYLTPARDLLSCLDACRMADFVLLALSAHEEVDEKGERILRCVESQGVSTVLTGIYGLNTIEPAKRRPDVSKSLKSYITHFFAAQEKLHDLSSRQDCSNVMRSLCTLAPKGIRWREDRSWMLVEEFNTENGETVVTGVVRGRGLKADRLVQVGEWGDFQIAKISAAPLTRILNKPATDTMAIDATAEQELLEEPSEEQDDLAELAPEEATMDNTMAVSVAPSERKAVLLDDHHYFDDDEPNDANAPKRLPKGTSKYQAAWYLGDMSDSGSDMEDVDDDDEPEPDADSTALGPADGHFDNVMQEPTEYGGPSEYPQSEAFLDPAPEEEADQLEAYRRQRREEAEEDLEFPDEIELHPGVLARERLARYRGLKNLRTSAWEMEEDKPYEPEEWSRLLEIADYKAAKNRVLKESLNGGVKPGTRVKVHLRLSAEQQQEVASLPRPTSLFSLLKHEHKRTSINVSMSLSSNYPTPLRSKEELILQCGPRRLVINPLFSQLGNTPNNVHKFDRYLHPGRTAVATFIGPMTWGSVPCLFFKTSNSKPASDEIEDLAQAIRLDTEGTSLQLIATGTLLPPSTGRVIAKRITLTGHPYKIHRKVVTVRYMFFNQEDIAYFRALELWTKRGRSGHIKEALGTHGYFKATFDGKINPLDSVAISLYKRVWPRPSRFWRPDADEP
jgi:pre-rRNA-processing protein TSR1